MQALVHLGKVARARDEATAFLKRFPTARGPTTWSGSPGSIRRGTAAALRLLGDALPALLGLADDHQPGEIVEPILVAQAVGLPADAFEQETAPLKLKRTAAALFAASPSRPRL